MHPPLKWAGGKRRLLPLIRSLLPTTFRRYVEPFLGGGAVALELLGSSRLDVDLSDANEGLIEFWSTLRDEPEALAARLVDVDADREAYYAVRAADAIGSNDSVGRAARFFYLNRLGFNGLCRLGKTGRSNVPYGRSRHDPRPPSAFDLTNLVAVGRALTVAGVRIHRRDFSASLETARPGDLFYLDPPYPPTGSRTGDFAGYTAEGFGLEDHRRLAASVELAASAGAAVVLSISDCAVSRELYGRYELTEISAPRSIAADGARRGPVPELLIRATRRPIRRVAKPIRRVR